MICKLISTFRNWLAILLTAMFVILTLYALTDALWLLLRSTNSSIDNIVLTMQSNDMRAMTQEFKIVAIKTADDMHNMLSKLDIFVLLNVCMMCVVCSYFCVKLVSCRMFKTMLRAKVREFVVLLSMSVVALIIAGAVIMLTQYSVMHKSWLLVVAIIIIGVLAGTLAAYATCDNRKHDSMQQ